MPKRILAFVVLLSACAGCGRLSYLTLLLQVSGLGVGRLLVGLLLLENRLGHGDVVLGGDAAIVSIWTCELCEEPVSRLRSMLVASFRMDRTLKEPLRRYRGYSR
jgi:pyruvate/2-oxoacid:ferredoxin oxidoreductase beta subunit